MGKVAGRWPWCPHTCTHMYTIHRNTKGGRPKGREETCGQGLSNYVAMLEKQALKSKNSERMHTHANTDTENTVSWSTARSWCGSWLQFSCFCGSLGVCMCGGHWCTLQVTSGEYLTQRRSSRPRTPLLLILCSSPDAGRCRHFPGFYYLKYLEEFSSVPFGP